MLDVFVAAVIVPALVAAALGVYYDQFGITCNFTPTLLLFYPESLSMILFFFFFFTLVIKSYIVVN